MASIEWQVKQELKSPDLVLWLKNIMEGIAERAKARCPVNTGELKDSISVVPDGDSFGIQMLDYGQYQEFGTIHDHPERFLGTAIDEIQQIASGIPVQQK
jgi:HK97 gp10 family phage protein